MEKAFDRLYQITKTRTQNELAEVIGVRQSSISDAKKRGSIPADWLLTLFRTHKANPDWILTGMGSQYLMLTPVSISADQTYDDLQSVSDKKDCPFAPLEVLASCACEDMPYNYTTHLGCKKGKCMMWRDDYCGLAGESDIKPEE